MVGVGVGVLVGVGLGLGVGVNVGTGVAVGLGVLVAVGVNVSCSCSVGLTVCCGPVTGLLWHPVNANAIKKIITNPYFFIPINNLSVISHYLSYCIPEPPFLQYIACILPVFPQKKESQIAIPFSMK